MLGLCQELGVVMRQQETGRKPLPFVGILRPTPSLQGQRLSPVAAAAAAAAAAADSTTLSPVFGAALQHHFLP